MKNYCIFAFLVYNKEKHVGGVSDKVADLIGVKLLSNSVLSAVNACVHACETTAETVLHVAEACTKSILHIAEATGYCILDVADLVTKLSISKAVACRD